MSQNRRWSRLENGWMSRQIAREGGAIEVFEARCPPPPEPITEEVADDYPIMIPFNDSHLIPEEEPNSSEYWAYRGMI